VENLKTMAVETAWITYQRQLLSFIRAKVGTAEDAEDILNDVFVKLLKVNDENNIPENISAWLFYVTKNSIVDYYRAKKSFSPLPEDFSIESEDVNAIKQLSKCMLPMIQALPDAYQQTLLLAEISKKKYREIAVELNLTVPSVKSRILRGRKMLIKSMARCCTLYRNGVGDIVDYEQKTTNYCGRCEN